MDSVQLIDSNGNTYDPYKIAKVFKQAEEYEESIKQLKTEFDRYSYLNFMPEFNNQFNVSDVINAGRKIDYFTSQPFILDYSPNYKPSDAKEVINRYNGLLSSANYSPDAKASSNGVFQLNADGTTQKRNTTDLGDSNDTDIVIMKDSGNGLEIGFRRNNQEYAWKGDAAIDQTVQHYQKVKEWLQDFTNTGVMQSGTNNYPIVQINSETDSGIAQALNGIKGYRIPGTQYYGYVLLDQATNDVIKVITQQNGDAFIQPYYSPQTGVNYGSTIIGLNTLNSILNGDNSLMRSGLETMLQAEADKLDDFAK